MRWSILCAVLAGFSQLSVSASANGTVTGHSRFEKVQGNPGLGYVELYEYKAFLSPVGSWL